MLAGRTLREAALVQSATTPGTGAAVGGGLAGGGEAAAVADVTGGVFGGAVLADAVVADVVARWRASSVVGAGCAVQAAAVRLSPANAQMMRVVDERRISLVTPQHPRRLPRIAGPGPTGR
jgi:hypothetical protein